MLALDVSESTTYGYFVGCRDLTPAVASCAMALVTLNIEENCEIYAFGGRLENVKSKFVDPGTSQKRTLLSALRETSKVRKLKESFKFHFI